VVLLPVRPRTLQTLDLWGTTGLGGVTPLPANAEGKAWIGPRCLETSHKLPELDSATDESLGPGTAARVSNVEINRHRVQHRGDDPRTSLKRYEVFNPCLRETFDDNVHHDCH
jgi:hypothetical protein